MDESDKEKAQPAVPPATAEPEGREGEAKARRALLYMLEDLEESRRKIERARKEWSTAFDAIRDPVFLHDAEFRILRANRAYAARAGLSVQTVIGKPYWQVFPRNSGPLPCCQRAAEKAEEEEEEEEVTLASSEIFRSRTFSVRDAQGAYLYSVHILEDITERRQAETRLRNSEQRYRQIIQTSMDGFWITDAEGRILDVNDAYCQMTGYSRDELLAMRIADVEAKERPEETVRHIQEIVTKGSARFETRHRRKDGRLLDIEVSTVFRPDQEDGRFLVFSRDITERKRALEALRQSAAELKEAQRVARLGSWDLDTGTGKVTWTEELYRIFGRDPTQPAPAYEEHPRLLTPESYARMNAAIEKTRQTGEPYELDLELVRPDGTRGWITARGEARRDFNGRIVGLRGTALDITERKRAEQALQRSNRALKTLSAGNEALLRAASESDLLQAMCRAIVEAGGYRMAWVGYAEHDTECTIRPVARAGIEEGYIESLRLTWADRARGQGPTSLAIRSGQVQVTYNILTDPRFMLWRDQAIKNGYASAIVLPLSDGQQVFGNLSIYAAEPEAFAENEIHLLRELADDLAFGILTLRTRNERDRLQREHLKSGEKLKATLIDTIRAIALTVEKRDPYTAGHQNRVAELCVAIGQELGLDAGRVEGLRLGAAIHDIGKIYVPAEILNRPGKLAPPEFEIIKSHPQVGYDIIRDVKFPWPVADMILQHHERLDGSGYPRGLKGGEIVLEARILAVADVVEAMSSHRPYRPSVGLEPALREITEHRSTRYDPAVVDACARLFREKGYKLAL